MDKSDKRGAQRLPIDHTVFMATGAGVPLKCRMTDISLTGARITLSDPKMAPQEFLILFDNGLTRWCQVPYGDPNRRSAPNLYRRRSH